MAKLDGFNGGRPAVYGREHRDVFLEALRAGYSVRHAAERAGPSAQRFYQWRQEDEVFGEEWAAAVEAGTDLLEDEAHRRAMHGVAKGVWYRGERVGEELEYSDKLLEVLLRARRPEKYAPAAQMKHSGTIESAVKLSFDEPQARRIMDNVRAALGLGQPQGPHELSVERYREPSERELDA